MTAIVALAWCHFAWVRPTNFLGHDEWLILSLTSRGIVSQPHAGRPLALLGSLPAALLAPHHVVAHYLLLGSYLALSGVLVWTLCRAVAPRLRLVAALAGAFAAVWAPMDYQRLASVHMAPYGWFTFGTLLALVLFLASLRRASLPLLAAAGVVATVTALSYEATLPLLLVAPLAATAARRAPRHRVTWAVAWSGGMLLLLAYLAFVHARLGPAASYQATYAVDLHPLRMAGRLLWHHRFDLVPVVSTPLAQVAMLPAMVCAGALILVVVCARAEEGPVEWANARGTLAILAAGGLGLAALAHVPFVTSAGLTTPNRTQFLCAPGTGIFLASVVLLLGSLLPPRLRMGAVVLLGGWIVAVSAGRTVLHQRVWDERTAYPAQIHLLARLVALAPDVRANTLIVLLDGRGAWPDTYGFEHALRSMYEGRARGYVWRASSLFYATTFDDAGIRREPREAIRIPWDESSSFHRYDETIAVRYGADGSVTILERWPMRVKATPGAASYDPFVRIVASGAAPASRALLRSVRLPVAAN
jgi:hypothetical protein